jgi:hypothetical protein
MDDLTIVYYTANRISPFFENNIVNSLKEVAGNTKIISVSWKPMDLGENILFEGIAPSCYYIYKQVLIGAERATTKYVACAEDDTIYTKEHFAFRPPDDTFAYNESHIEIYKGNFIHRNQRNMSTCISNRELMVDTLRRRFEKFPNFLDSKKGETRHFSEPGRHERKLGLPEVKMMGFSTDAPPIVFWHRPSMGGIRQIKVADRLETDHPYWGNAKELWYRFYRRPDVIT